MTMKISDMAVAVAMVLAVMVVMMMRVSSSALNENLVENTCKNTPHYNLCMKVLTADPKSKTADLPELGLIAVAEIKKKSLQIMAAINKTADRKLKPALKECHDKYNAVIVGDVPVAERAIRGNPKFAEGAVADAKFEALGCERAFQGLAPSPFTKENNYIAGVADVARGIIRNLL